MIFIYNYRFTNIYVKISIDILLIYLIYLWNASTDIYVFMDILILGLNGYVDRLIACLVAKRYTQVNGYDYYGTFSYVAKISSVRLFFMAAMSTWPLYQLDIKNVFLYGELAKEVYIDHLVLLHRESLVSYASYVARYMAWNNPLELGSDDLVPWFKSVVWSVVQ